MTSHTTVPAVPDARVRRFLETELVLWLTTGCGDRAPHIVPVWFWWDGDAILVYSKPNALKVRCLRDDPRAALALGDAEDDFDVGLIEARAQLLDAPPALPPGFVAKYRDRMARGRLDEPTFAAIYTQAIRLVPTRFKPWHGRGARPDRGAPGPLSRVLARLVAPLAALRPFDRATA